MNKTIFLAVLMAACSTLISCKSKMAGDQQVKSEKTDSAFVKTGSVERLSPGMDEIIPPGELPEIIAKGFKWTEGPVWIPGRDILLFSDIPNNSIFQWSETEGLKLYLKPAGSADTVTRSGETGSNGLLLDKNGNLILCQHGDRRIVRMDAPLDKPEPRFISLVDKWNGKRLNSPNDAILSSKGDLLFIDPPYGLEKGFDDPKREINFAGVFNLTADGRLILLTDKMSAPNGLALSPDESKLYVSNSGKGDQTAWMEFELRKDGTVDKGKKFFDPSKENKETGGGDGMKVRKDGTIFASGPDGIWIFSPDGKHLGTIKTGHATSNCALDDMGKYLYITTDVYLMRIRLKS